MNKNQVIDVLAPFGVALITFLIFWGKAILGQHKQRFVWRAGVCIGAIGSLFSAIGFVAPMELYPCMSYMTCNMIMAGCILYSMYSLPVSDKLTAEELRDIREGKVNFIIQMGIGAGFILFIMVIVGFTTGQKEGQVVNASVSSAMNRLSIEVSSLSKRLGLVEGKVNGLNTKADSSAKYDTARMKVVIEGQKRILDQASQKRK